jgi:tetratricopeptide (TPR) repeat protein
MTRIAIAVTLLLLSAHLRAAEVTRAGRYTFHSSFWINLHETLMDDAAAKAAPDRSALPADEAEAWRTAVEVYRKNKSGRNIDEFEKATTINPAYSASYNQLGYVYRFQGNYAEAEQAATSSPPSTRPTSPRR